MFLTPVFAVDNFFLTLLWGDGSDSISNRVATSCGEKIVPSGNCNLCRRFSESASDRTFSCLFSSIRLYLLVSSIMS